MDGGGMNETNREHFVMSESVGGAEAALLERDLLISRLVDSDAADAAWERATALGASDPTLWRDVAIAQRQHVALARAVNQAVMVADGVDLPSEIGVSEFGDRRATGTGSGRGSARVFSRWSGWAAAAMIGLAWASVMVGDLAGNAGSTGTASSAGFDPTNWRPQSRQEALNKYLEVGQKDGTVIGEIPRVLMIESRPAENGRVEVFYLRQFMERAVVSDLYQVVQDERGQPVSIPIKPGRPGGKL